MSDVLTRVEAPPPEDAPDFSELIERAHQQALENLFDAVVVTDMDGRIVDWNSGSERLYGYTREEAIGQPVNILHVPEDRDQVLTAVLEGIRRDGRWDGQVRLLRKDGTRGWIESAVVPVADRSGRVVGALGINRDISGRVEAERERREAEARFRTLVEHSLVGIYIIRDERFLYVNPMFVQMVGYSAEELVSGVRALDLVASEDRQLVAENLRNRMAGERLDARYSFRAVRKDGVVIVVEVHGSQIQLDGAPAVIGMVQDVTDRRKAERELRESEERYRLIVDDMLGRVATVIASRERLRHRYLGAEVAASDPPETVDPDAQRFLAQVRSAILEHLNDETYSVERLARDVAHSRSQLHRRLRQLLDESPSRLIRSIRLEQAGRLLREADAPVADVAFAVGFKSPSHFSNAFAEHFGVRPSTYRRGAG